MKKNKLKITLAIALSMLMVLTSTPVSATADKLLLTKKTVSIKKGKTQTVKIKATGNYKFKKAVIKKNSNKSIAKVTIKKSKVKIKGLKEGSAKVTLKISYKDKTQTRTKNLILSVRVTNKNAVMNTPLPVNTSNANQAVAPNGAAIPKAVITPAGTIPEATLPPKSTITPVTTIPPDNTMIPIATVTPETTSTPDSGSYDLTSYGSYISNKLPYGTNGLSITNITFDNSNKVYVSVKNNTGNTISSSSYISYKCYDSAGIVTKTGNLYLEDLNNGESCNVFMYKTSSTVKVVFNGSSVKKGNESDYQEMTEYGSYLSNSLPYETNGLSITNITFDNSNKVYVSVKNNTGNAISSSSYVSYKCYDSAGIVTKTSKLYLENINNGETCKVFFYKTSDTIKIVFGGSSVKYSEENISQETTTYGSYISNKLPYETNGLSITNITFDNSNKVYVSVKNNTGDSISSSSYVSYKCYDSAGIVTKTSKLYLEDINNGEACRVFFYKTSDTVKVIFDNSSIIQGTGNQDQETTAYGSYISNVLPYKTNGLSITNITFDNSNKVYVTVKNNTGNAISSSSYISYKCYDSAGIVTKTSKLYLENIDNGETCRVFFYKTSDAVKVIFDNSSIERGTETQSQETTTYGSYISNKLPYGTNGLSITNITFDNSNKVYVSVKNNTGDSISSSSNVSYKCYDSAGIVTKTSKLYLENINNGETCKVSFYKTSDTVKVVFYVFSIL